MAIAIKPKVSHVAANVPTTSDLVAGEFAINTADQKVYIRDASNNIVTVANKGQTAVAAHRAEFGNDGMAENLAEVIEDMGRSLRRAVKNALTIILIHLLKYRYQAERRTNSWRATIREHWRRLRDEVADSPSLRPYIEQILDAREAAADESGLPIATFPTACPVSLEQPLDHNFLPK